MDLEHKAIERLKLASDMSLQYYQQPLVVTASGGNADARGFAAGPADKYHGGKQK